jgi:sialate O-acetylesterase
MVLQQAAKIPVWGWADAGEAVTVTLGTTTAKATADASGKWRVDLTPVAMTATPLTLTVTGKNSLKLDDVLVGDVWVCSGQSNMEFGMTRADDAATEIPKANDPLIRLFVVNKDLALDPLPDTKGQWVLCTPATVAGFSAVGYFFGRDVREKYNRPVGLIATYWGGTPAQAWTSLSALQKDPPFANYINAYNTIVAHFSDASAKYPQAQADYQEQKKQWDASDGASYAAAMKEWNDAVKQAVAAGQPPPPRPQPTHPMPKAPQPPQGGSGTPTVLFNTMIAPIIPYSIKGVIWYQGESNAGAGIEYRTLFPRMITDWRDRWSEGNFPFLFVQLANLNAPQVKPSEGGWALLREAQLMTLALPDTGMAVAVDIGNPTDIHPKDKIDVAQRLFLAARHVAYGETLVYSGPIYDSMKVDGNKIRLTFKDTGSGLQMSTPPWTPTGIPVPTPTELKGFAIAGDDKNFVWANAVIDGNQVVVSSDQVAAPVAVRYDWATNPPGNLYNKEGLPASPFRTDDWVDSMPMAHPPAPAPTPPPASSPPPASMPAPAPTP